MTLDLDPIFYTETMVKILQEQGSTLYAMELAEKILEQNPGNESVRNILKKLKEEAKSSFDRFRQAGHSYSKEASNNGQKGSSPSALEDTKKSKATFEVKALDRAPKAQAIGRQHSEARTIKIKKLEGYLSKLQRYRKSHEAR